MKIHITSNKKKKAKGKIYVSTLAEAMKIIKEKNNKK